MTAMALHWKHGAPRTVFITGGGSGIGREFALLLAREGASVAIFNRRLAPQVEGELRAAAAPSGSQRFASYAADVTDEAALTAAFGQAQQDVGAPDLVVNSAGILVSAPFPDLAASDFAREVQINLVGSRNTAAVAVRHLRPGGHLVLVASLAGLVGNYGYAAYGASKFGVVGLARALDLDLLPLGIDVSVCCPGVIHTPMVAHEQQVEHPTTRLLAEMPGVMEVGPACRGLLRGIARRRFLIKVGFKARATAWLTQHLPGLMRVMSRAIVRRSLG